LRHYRPGDPRQLVGQRHHRDIEGPRFSNPASQGEVVPRQRITAWEPFTSIRRR
jgi:hypothetical protein